MKNVLKVSAVFGVLLASGAAYADDPIAAMRQDQHPNQQQTGNGNGAAFSDVGPCQAGQQSEAFPNAQGFRCVPKH